MAMGYLFENLVRRFNEQANEEAGDYFTPKEVIRLMVNLLYIADNIATPGKVMTVYDPTCGTGGMLSISEEHILEHNPQAVVKLFGQEYNPESYAICGSDLLIKSEDVTNIIFGDTLGTGKNKEGFVDSDGIDKHFHSLRDGSRVVPRRIGLGVFTKRCLSSENAKHDEIASSHCIPSFILLVWHKTREAGRLVRRSVIRDPSAWLKEYWKNCPLGLIVISMNC